MRLELKGVEAGGGVAGNWGEREAGRRLEVGGGGRSWFNFGAGPCVPE